MAIEALGAGLTGMQRGYQGLGEAANTIAKQSTQGAQAAAQDFATPLVQMATSERQTEASASVLRTADQMIGTLIDVMA